MICRIMYVYDRIERETTNIDVLYELGSHPQQNCTDDSEMNEWMY